MKKRNLVILLIALAVVAGLGFAGFRLFGATDLAEGYLYEEENLLLYAKVTQAEEIGVEITEWRVVTEKGIPVLKTREDAYKATVDEHQLTLRQDGEKTWSASVTKEELILHDPVTEGLAADTKWQASDPAGFEAKRKALEERVQQQAEQKKKEQAIEEERVRIAEAGDKFKRLKADLQENSEYLDATQFSDETSVAENQLAHMQSLLEEVRLYAEQTSMNRMEFEVMQATVDSMKVIRDGTGTIQENIDRKKTGMVNLTEILEADVAELDKIWEQVISQLPDAKSQEEEYKQVKETVATAIAKAKERLAAGEQTVAKTKQEIEALYGNAATMLQQAKAKYQF